MLECKNIEDFVFLMIRDTKFIMIRDFGLLKI